MPKQISANDVPTSQPFPVQCPKCLKNAGVTTAVEVGAPDPKARHITLVCYECHHCWRVNFHVSD
jgi:hypothetical protein